jgi:hypothetical protein
LPAGRVQQRDAWAAPALGEHQAERHGGGAGEARQQPDRVKPGGGGQHGQGYSRGAHEAGDHRAQGDPLGQQQDGQAGDDQGLRRAEDGGHPAG